MTTYPAVGWSVRLGAFRVANKWHWLLRRVGSWRLAAAGRRGRTTGVRLAQTLTKNRPQNRSVTVVHHTLHLFALEGRVVGAAERVTGEGWQTGRQPRHRPHGQWAEAGAFGRCGGRGATEHRLAVHEVLREGVEEASRVRRRHVWRQWADVGRRADCRRRCRRHWRHGVTVARCALAIVLNQSLNLIKKK